MLHKNTISVITRYSVLILCILGFSSVNAQVDIPSGSERRPNLSMDPFERAREAVKSLPGSSSRPSAPATTEPARELTTSQPTAVEPVEPIQTEEAAEAFSYGGAVIADLLSVVSGGGLTVIEENEEGGTTEIQPPSTAYPVLLDLAGEIDTEAAGLWKNGTFLIHLMGYGGTTPGDMIGDFHGLSSIDAGEKQFFKLLEAWYQHSFDYGKSSFLVGIHDWNSEFYIAEYANLFMNGAFGMGSVIGVAAGPSSYPATTVGFRYHSALTEDSYFQFGVYDGVADEGDFFQVSFGQDDGIFVGAEVGLTNKEPGEDGYYKAAVGGWFLGQTIESYTGTEEGETFIDVDGNEIPMVTAIPESAPGTYGVYLLGEMAIGDNIGVFFKFGYADPNYNRFSQFMAGGLNYSGLIPDRVDDVLGVAATYTTQSSVFIDDNSVTQDFPAFTGETTIEVTYSAVINDWLMVQPDLQFIRYPAMSHALLDSTVVGIRVQAEF